MANPLFWLALSLFCVAVSFTAVVLMAVPAMRELSRAANRAEKLLDTLDRELPPTLDALRRTGDEVAELTDELNQGVQSAGRIIGQVDEGLASTRQQVTTLHRGSRSLWVGVQAAWQVWADPRSQRRPKPKKLGHRRSTLAEGRPSSAQGNRPREGARDPMSSENRPKI
ncbi:DUF948 domain-containing protein [Leptolyngbya sp. BL0902]|uniref:DUF948 domain-containing protein n=1 Tax=Leptolyngbya sp. BL0902 TaxID=1115757 RepID=UPI0018E8CB3D|nr:DUF948 domain-containing protein [Leptolyngbya sp. BL0902]